MDPEKFVQFQQQMRENSTEYQDFLKDLDGWTDDIKKKDEKLKTVNIEEKSQLPPIRNSLSKKKTKKKSREPKNTNRISGFDFKSWDKYDVDKALEEVDHEEDEEEYETDEEWEEKRTKEQANLLKEQGNQRFKEEKYVEAIECYTNAIRLDPQNVVLLSNRSMALLKQNKFGAAEEDTSVAIAIDNTFGKAYYRRAMARIGLNKLEAAKADLEKLLKLEPNNKLVKKELEKIDKQLNPEDFNDVGIVKPITKPPHKRSKKPLRKIKIEEIGKSKQDKPAKKIQEISPIQSKSPQIVKEQPKVTQILTTKSTEKENMVLEAPTSSLQLEKTWKAIRDDKKNLHSYFEKIDKKSYTKLFGFWFETCILEDILEILKKFYKNKEAFSTLLDISLIKRFSTAYSFLEKPYRDYIKQITDEFSNDNEFDRKVVERFIKLQR
ncbi:DgyrCDS7884 [Dimorphilus gyrociliatus]|uniref:RNA polymerase II-associated protein 3 n=1 Tax=Dimorphilus gyrociliatus TaxID=2664684 RepID=A0A7I8VXC8_9ANNE|nr:DgyrCDS7884 [Dimorphilus gyrociliatus]